MAQVIRRAAILSTVIGMIGLQGCAPMGGAKKEAAPSLDGTAWTLDSWPGQSTGSRPTLRFEGGRVTGSDGCNRYSGSYTESGSKLAISLLASTQMACEAEVATRARAFTTALTGARSYQVAGDRLELRGADGKVVAILAAQSQDLAGTHWRATGINNGRSAVVSLVDGTNVTLAFGTDGRATGSAGCNSYTTTYKASGSNVTFAPAAATRKMCPQPAGVMEQETAFLKALETVTDVQVDGDRLELRTASGTLAVGLTRDTGG